LQETDKGIPSAAAEALPFELSGEAFAKRRNFTRIVEPKSVAEKIHGVATTTKSSKMH
jgi:hypothetical protein